MKKLLCLGLLLWSCTTLPPKAQEGPEVPEAPTPSMTLPLFTWMPAGEGTYAVNLPGVLRVEVSPDQGGRISSLKWMGQEILKPGAGLLEGATFWAAPQKAWNRPGHWPPSPAWDSETYGVTLNSTQEALTLTGERDPDTGIRIVKTLTAKRTPRPHLEIRYTLENLGTKALQVAPWEVVRVQGAGTAVFPQGENPQWVGTGRLQSTREEAGLLWYTPGEKTGRKMFRDAGKAWMAWDFGPGVFLRYLESDVALEAFAPGEAEAEIYAGEGYTELENQGSWEILQPQDQRHWTVQWVVTDQLKVPRQGEEVKNFLQGVQDFRP